MKGVEGGEGGFLSFVSRLQILLFLNISFIVHFWMMVGSHNGYSLWMSDLLGVCV